MSLDAIRRQTAAAGLDAAHKPDRLNSTKRLGCAEKSLCYWLAGKPTRSDNLQALHNLKEIEADVATGVPDNVVRTVTENSRTLKFDTHGFERK